MIINYHSNIKSKRRNFRCCDVDKRGPCEGHFCPEIYFDGPLMNQRMKSLSVQWEWRDQGHGNRKGMLWVQLVRGTRFWPTE